MPKITALIHAHDAGDAQRLARALDSLRCCDDLLIVNHGFHAEIDNVAREHGARCKAGVPGVSPGAYLVDARHDWIFCVLPQEALSDALEATMLQWKQAEHNETCGFACGVREENGQGSWRQLPPETRLVNRSRVNWTTELPARDGDAELLEGDLLRFQMP